MKTKNNIKTRDVAGIFLTCPDPSGDGFKVAVVEGKPKPSKNNERTASLPKGVIDIEKIPVDNQTSPDAAIRKVAELEDQEVMETGPEAAIRELAEETSIKITEEQLLRDMHGELSQVYYERKSESEKRKELGKAALLHRVTIFMAYIDHECDLVPDEKAHDIEKAYWVKLEDLETTLTHKVARLAVREIIASLVWNKDDMKLLEEASGSH